MNNDKKEKNEIKMKLKRVQMQRIRSVQGRI